MSTLNEQFNQAQLAVKALSNRPSNADLLTLYTLFKQATEGDATGERPGATAFVARAKFDAWVALAGMASVDAMQKYIDVVESLLVLNA
ncbi:hypothetical protein DTO96_100387 [Ephemeroptericola cinctiostellae]|uniref:ACB domain-containing protein n=1 Tax=Ephemeroptericola cinctiostellae TaxID=2268024 RepID=A0A345D8I9_9BURK|nr:acyl-CoA-binding protein [Ephemeroptericola cinctiostellae]AXF84677.1 hypothetical protein DTO96_100387 [Ephemeroptericola cinctiostellae]